jgi:hypothetical protein
MLLAKIDPSGLSHVELGAARNWRTMDLAAK